MNPSFLATIGAVVMSKVALGSVFGTLAALASAQVDVQELPVLAVVVAISATVGAKDMVDGLAHLFDVCVGAGIQRILHDRLLRAPADTERLTQGRVGAQLGIDLHHPVRSGQQQYQRIAKFVKGSVLDGLLSDLNIFPDGSEQINVMQ